MKGRFESVDGTITVDPITTQIATIQDSMMPEVEHRLPGDDITIPFRDSYKRHNFVGLNAYLVEMASQFSDQTGLSLTDPMTYADTGAQLSIDTMQLHARHETAAITLDLHAEADRLVAAVTVENLTGHRLPSGVGFRCAFLELKVTGPDQQVLWCSGCSNDAGVILGADGTPLKTAFLDVVPDGATEALYQPHHRQIDSPDQVQIYEELTQNAKGAFTTSFLHRIRHPKDNRLTPYGALTPGTDAFRARFGDSDVTAAFLKATLPEGDAARRRRGR